MKYTGPSRAPVQNNAPIYIGVSTYTIVGVAWLFTLDKVLNPLITVPALRANLHRLSLLAFVVVTAAGLGLLLTYYRRTRRHTSRAPRDHEDPFRTLFHGLEDAVLIAEVGPDGAPGAIREANPAACRWLGSAPETLQRLPILEILPPAQRDSFRQQLATLTPQAPLRYTPIRLEYGARWTLADLSVHPWQRDGKPALLCIARDLTEQQNAAEALEETSVTLSALFHASPLAIIILDPDGKVTNWNAAAETLFGWNEAQVLGRVLPTIPDDEQEAFLAKLPQVAAGAAVDQEECRYRRRNGTLVDVSSAMAPIRDDQGGVIGIINILADISDRKRVEQDMRRANRALTLLSEIKQTAIHASDEQGLLHDACQVLVGVGGYLMAWIGFAESDSEKSVRPAAQAGYDVGYIEAVKSTWADGRRFMDPTGTAIRTGKTLVVRNLLNEAGNIPWIAEALNRGYGSIISLPLTAAWRPLGALTILAGTPEAFDREEVELLQRFVDDLTYGMEMLGVRHEHQRAEEALFASAQHWRSTFDAISDPLCVIDREGKIVRCNKSLTHLVGLPFDEIIGRTAHEVIYTHFASPESSSLLTRVWDTWRSMSEEVQCGERWFRVTVDPLTDDMGNLIGAIHVMVDISERKETEEELRQSFSRLQRITDDTIAAISKIVEMRDPYTAGHEQRVSELSCAIATAMQLPAEQLEGLRVAGMLHDIGKIYVPAEMLSKSGKLSELEFGVIKTHSQAGYQILQGIDFPWPVAQMVYQHHERLDGSGYPNGLKGGAILLEARILAVADVVESMSTHRPYRPALGIEKALEEIIRLRGIAFDPQVVDTCVELFTKGGFSF